jgi:hypothetical protein
MRTRDKRALTLAAIAAAIFAGLQFGVLPVWDRMQAERDGLAVREQTLLKYREAIESKDSREAAAGALERRLQEAERGLLSGGTPAIASAGLRQQVQQLAEEHGMEVVSIQFLPERQLSNDYLQTPLGVQLKGRIDGLARLLEACESGSTTLSVLGVTIQSTDDKQKILNVNLRVAGILPRNKEAAGSG